MQATKRIVMLADMESFYAGIEKAARPELRERPLAVVGDPSVRSSAVLAACPIAKRHGIRTGERLDAAWAKCPELVPVRPRMNTYMEVSAQIVEILQSYTDLVEPYSIDEMFAEVTDTLHLYGRQPEELAKLIQTRIALETGVRARFGIGANKAQAKLACDLVAKAADSGIYLLHTKQDWEKRIWPAPVRRMWGVGRRMEKHLQTLRILTIGDLAQMPLAKLKARWGINGEVLWRVANGLDDSPVSPWSAGEQKEIGTMITLPRPYVSIEELETVLLDLCTELGRRARRMRRMGSRLSVSVYGEGGYGRAAGSRRMAKLLDPSDITSELFEAARQLLREAWEGVPARRIGLTLSGLSSAEVYQPSLFADRDRQRAIDRMMDEIKDRFGETAIARGRSLAQGGRAKERAEKIGGHYK